MSELLVTIGQTCKQNTRILLTAAMLGVLSSTIFMAPSQAARIVYDPKNTAEAVKILKESQNIANTVGKQLGLSEQDLKNINEFADKYTKIIETHSKAIEKVMSQHGGFVGGKIKMSTKTDGGADDEDIEITTADKWLGGLIPAAMDQDGRISFSAKNIARMAAAGAIMSNNKDVLEAYGKITEELAKSEQTLQELLKKNAELGIDNGGLAAQQLNNQIKGLETHISGLHAQMDALAGQSKILESQAKAQEAQNDQKLAEASAKATSDYIKSNYESFEEGSSNYHIKHPW